ncbi:MAG: N-acetylmuramoyl-L-alanine amidase [Lachnospiraceae bacterium]|nr:N-acetylmuramoyl-L-alanine amidase [Lachnospiraceae bacterium]
MSNGEKERQLRRELRRIERKKQERIRQLLMSGLLCVSTLIIFAAGIVLYKMIFQKKPVDPATVQVPEYVDVRLLTPNEYSRPELPLEEVKGIVVHYVGNPCSTALENRNYFESLKDQKGSDATSVSSHFVIGMEGEVIQCIPLYEVAYASNHRNSDTISIECCHPDTTGKFYDSTYTSVVNLCAYLCREFELEAEAVIRHYDVTGKACPKYFVDYEDEWERFQKDVAAALEVIK